MLAGVTCTPLSRDPFLWCRRFVFIFKFYSLSSSFVHLLSPLSLSLFEKRFSFIFIPPSPHGPFCVSFFLSPNLNRNLQLSFIFISNTRARGPWTLLDLQAYGERKRLKAKIDDEEKGLYGVEIGKGIIRK